MPTTFKGYPPLRSVKTGGLGITDRDTYNTRLKRAKEKESRGPHPERTFYSTEELWEVQGRTEGRVEREEKNEDHTVIGSENQGPY